MSTNAQYFTHNCTKTAAKQPKLSHKNTQIPYKWLPCSFPSAKSPKPTMNTH